MFLHYILGRPTSELISQVFSYSSVRENCHFPSKKIALNRILFTRNCHLQSFFRLPYIVSRKIFQWTYIVSRKLTRILAIQRKPCPFIVPVTICGHYSTIRGHEWTISFHPKTNMDFNSTITVKVVLEIYIIWVLYTIIGYFMSLSYLGKCQTRDPRKL